MKLEFLNRFSTKYANIKFHVNPFSGRRVVPCGRTDGHDVANSRFLRTHLKIAHFPICSSIVHNFQVGQLSIHLLSFQNLSRILCLITNNEN